MHDPGGLATGPRATLSAAVAERVAFDFDEESFTWADVAEAAAIRGEWDRLVARVRAGLAAEAAVPPDRQDAVREEARAAGIAFRQQRNLLTADGFTAWLERWDITVDGWRAYLRRELALAAGTPDAAHVDQPGPATEQVHAAAVLSGLLADQSALLAEDLALLGGVPDAEDRSAALAAIVADGTAARAAAVDDPEALEAIVTRHRMDWSRAAVDLVTLPDEAAADEAALCVRLDGQSLADVAALVGTRVDSVDGTLSDLPEPLRGPAVGSQPGDLLGPVEDDGVYRLAVVVSRVEPAADDPEALDRARSLLLARVVEERTRGRVRWGRDG
ncbi:MAG: hypothetical protein R2737_15975 [Candidatus Nanopelagicales bacterium]